MSERQEKARVAIRNVASAWNRGVEKGEAYSKSLDPFVKPKGKPKKSYRFGTTEYKQRRIL